MTRSPVRAQLRPLSRIELTVSVRKELVEQPIKRWMRAIIVDQHIKRWMKAIIVDHALVRVEINTLRRFALADLRAQAALHGTPAAVVAKVASAD